jgi:hypothetical protein
MKLKKAGYSMTKTLAPRLGQRRHTGSGFALLRDLRAFVVDLLILKSFSLKGARR